MIWPADAHVIGKDITRFHCLYWPAMLLSAGLPLPRSVAVHGFMTLEGQRISKTTGNIIDPVELVDAYGGGRPALLPDAGHLVRARRRLHPRPT